MSAGKSDAEKVIATNPNARNKYHIDEVVEAGIVLQGTEVKSIRQHAPNIRDAFVEVVHRGTSKVLEAWILNISIAHYSHGNIWNHEPVRKRKLLLHRRQINHLFGAIGQKGYSAIPLRMYFKNGRIKLELGLGKGKKKHDQREDIKKKDVEKQMRQALRK